ncbi:pancreatic triacylglycerol lipase-like, partial [Orussus abietinus]|uniref:pancreatic triacylglycerol lipase-like n=1 Tax=Orussus abietinus TaxID=222816 RepID=UPI000C71635E
LYFASFSSGLDPAYPGFYQLDAEHLERNDARFVDVIHTDGGVYGVLQSTGTADFFANGGKRPQPGCALIGIPLSPISLCSHWRSWRLYSETVKNSRAFLAEECSSYAIFALGLCRNNKHVYFGYSSPTNISGKFYFDTYAEPPFKQRMLTTLDWP